MAKARRRPAAPSTPGAAPVQVFPPGAKVYLDGRYLVKVLQAFPEGSTSHAFPHYTIRAGNETPSAVAMNRIGVVKNTRGRGLSPEEEQWARDYDAKHPLGTEEEARAVAGLPPVENPRGVSLLDPGFGANYRRGAGAAENPTGPREYRGWRIDPQEVSTQLGYRLPDYGSYGGLSTRPGKGRKIKGYQIHGPDGATKWVGTLVDAHQYIDQYEGAPAAENPLDTSVDGWTHWHGDPPNEVGNLGPGQQVQTADGWWYRQDGGVDAGKLYFQATPGGSPMYGPAPFEPVAFEVAGPAEIELFPSIDQGLEGVPLEIEPVAIENPTGGDPEIASLIVEWLRARGAERMGANNAPLVAGLREQFGLDADTAWKILHNVPDKMRDPRYKPARIVGNILAGNARTSASENPRPLDEAKMRDSRYLLKRAESIMDGLQSAGFKGPEARRRFAADALPTMKVLAAWIARSDDPGAQHYFDSWVTRLEKAALADAGAAENPRKRAAPVDPNKAKRAAVYAALWEDPVFLRLEARKDAALHAWNVADAYKNSPAAKPGEVEAADRRAKYAMKQSMDYEAAALKKAGLPW